MPHPSSPIPLNNLSDEDLLKLYLSLPAKRREVRFTDTAHAAEITGVSARTVQLWIEGGVVQAVLVGRKYKVDLESLEAYLQNQMRKRRG